MIIGSKIYHLKNCPSSMDLAKNSIDKDPDGTVFWTDKIENARGRQGRSWECYPGQLLLTILLKPDFSSKNIEISLNKLIMAFSVAIANILKAHKVSLKWPNDFITQNKKVGGIMAETVWRGNTPCAVIVGIGLNVNNIFDPIDKLHKIATSLKEVSSKDFNLQLLLDRLLEESNKLYNRWQNSENDDIYQTWKNYQFYLGKIIKVHKDDGTLIVGHVDDFLPNGDLLLTDKLSIKHKINFCQTWTVENI